MSNFYEEPTVLDSLVSFDQNDADEKLIIKRTQEIDETFLKDLADKRLASTNDRANDFYHVASIPVEVVDELLRRYGFDVLTAPVRETLAMLRRLDLDKFLATQKRI
jgi:hypothetical protein